MMKMIALILSTSLSAFAHEGHDHGPSTVQAPKGGLIRSLETVHLELLTTGKDLKLYVYDMDLKTADPAKYPVKATVTLPRKKPQKLDLVAKSDHWEATFDAGNAHRYTLALDIKQGGHDDTVKWVVEPKKK